MESHRTGDGRVTSKCDLSAVSNVKTGFTDACGNAQKEISTATPPYLIELNPTNKNKNKNKNCV
jgi:hypothetical protein